MKFMKLLTLLISLLLLFSIVSLAQEMKMMKKDTTDKMMMQKEDMMKKEMTDKDMIKDDMMHKNTTMKIDKDMNGIAIKGYDPVAYFTDNMPVMGKKMYSYEWMGAEWHFQNESNKMMFMENPVKYAPKYGGHCAYGVSVNGLYSTDPTVWTINNGNLYLNKNKDTGEKFRSNLDENIEKADMNWPHMNIQKGM